LKLEEYHDTADSAKDLKEKNDREVAAIASRYAAEYYGLNLLAESIETEKQNFTKFLILTTDKKYKVLNPTKATLSFQLPNKVGALADMLKIVVDNRINITKIQSIPIVGKPNEYNFYVDVEWENYEDFRRSIQINSIVKDLIILGEYQKGEMIHDYSKSKQA
jgi:prephenate dehydratase